MSEEPQGTVEMLEIDKILVPEERIRSVLEQETLDELEASIDELGVLQPIQCLLVDGQTILLDGYHRLLASKKLGKLKVPGIVRPGNWSEVLIHNFVMNRVRGKSDPVGEGLVLKTLIEEHGLTQQEAATKCGISKGWASKLLRIQKLDSFCLGQIREGKLTVASAFHIAALEDHTQRRQVAEDAINWNYSEQQTKDRVKLLLTPDYPEEELSHTFDTAGMPEPVFPRCHICEAELKTAEKILRLCIGCYDTLEDSRLAVPSPEPEPVPPPQQHYHQPPPQQQYYPCQHGRVIRTVNNELICLECNTVLGMVRQ